MDLIGQLRHRPGPDASLPFNSEQLAFTLSAFARGKDVTFARLPFGWPRIASRFATPLDFLGKDGGGAVGTGPGHTIGAALALKDSGRLTIGVIGDGDYLMGVNALWTAANLKLPMMMVVANNRSYFNDEVHQESMARQRNRPVENKGIGQKLDNPAPRYCRTGPCPGFRRRRAGERVSRRCGAGAGPIGTRRRSGGWPIRHRCTDHSGLLRQISSTRKELLIVTKTLTVACGAYDRTWPLATAVASVPRI